MRRRYRTNLRELNGKWIDGREKPARRFSTPSKRCSIARRITKSRCRRSSTRRTWGARLSTIILRPKINYWKRSVGNCFGTSNRVCSTRGIRIVDSRLTARRLRRSATFSITCRKMSDTFCDCWRGNATRLSSSVSSRI